MGFSISNQKCKIPCYSSLKTHSSFYNSACFNPPFLAEYNRDCFKFFLFSFFCVVCSFISQSFLLSGPRPFLFLPQHQKQRTYLSSSTPFRSFYLRFLDSLTKLAEFATSVSRLSAVDLLVTFPVIAHHLLFFLAHH